MRLRTIHVFLVISFILHTSNIFGQFYTGNDLYKWRQSQHRINLGNTQPTSYQDAARFHGYVTGVVDCYDTILFNVPASVTAGQLGDIVYKYLEDYPEKRHQSGSSLVLDAIRNAFPLK